MMSLHACPVQWMLFAFMPLPSPALSIVKISEDVLADTGGKREVDVPPSLGFGDRGISLRGTEHAPGKEPAADVPPNASLHYELELLRVSIPPS